jgi:RNA polymerase sigma factor (sigma-70 family)
MSPESPSPPTGRDSAAGAPPERVSGAWVDRLLDLARALRSAPSSPGGDAFGEFWLLLNLALRHHFRMQALKGGGIEPADAEDLAAEKALDLINRFDSGGWKVEESSPGELVAFLRTVARNGLIDHRRREYRRTVLPPEETDNLTQDAERSGSPGNDPPDAAVDRGDYAAALIDCASRLAPRQRAVWIFRVFYDMPSKLIASHPEVGLKPSHVDVILKRCRIQVRDCMSGKGFDPASPPPGVFAAIWGAFRTAGLVREGGPHE